jgi:hypothetical protein
MVKAPRSFLPFYFLFSPSSIILGIVSQSLVFIMTEGVVSTYLTDEFKETSFNYPELYKV